MIRQIKIRRRNIKVTSVYVIQGLILLYFMFEENPNGIQWNKKEEKFGE